MTCRMIGMHFIIILLMALFFTCIGYACFDVSAQELSTKQTDYISSWKYTLCSFKLSSASSGGCLYISCLMGASICKYNISYACSYNNTSMISCFYNKDSSELSLSFPSFQDFPIFPDRKIIIVVLLFFILGSLMTGCFGMFIGTLTKEDRVVAHPFPIHIPTLRINQGPL